METILDGTGKGYEAQVNDHNQLVTFSITEVEDKAQNKEGRQWSVPIEVTPALGVSTFFVLENTGTSLLAITDIRSYCGSAGEVIVMEWATGTPTFTASSSIVAVPKNGGSSKTPVATITQDTKTTGLTTDGVIYHQVLDTANKLDKLSTSANIILTQGSKFIMSSTTGNAKINAIVSIVELND